MNDGVLALHLAGSSILAGGRFQHAGGKARAHLAAIALATGMPTDWDPGSSYDVQRTTRITPSAPSPALRSQSAATSAASRSP